jgi:hypothetical protein
LQLAHARAFNAGSTSERADELHHTLSTPSSTWGREAMIALPSCDR